MHKSDAINALTELEEFHDEKIAELREQILREDSSIETKALQQKHKDYSEAIEELKSYVEKWT
jgi:hypothetical protein